MLRKKKNETTDIFMDIKIPDKPETKRSILSENFYQHSFIYFEE